MNIHCAYGASNSWFDFWYKQLMLKRVNFHIAYIFWFNAPLQFEYKSLWLTNVLVS